uniref:WD_REPEATS_REGION domain-containing protein n=1 Tax=Schistocephalus solidus TaxID=70667 RepID=A0A183TK00_SCHSO
LLYDISVLLPSSKFLANNYSFDIANVSSMCAHNLALATSTARPDLIRFWTCCSSLANSQLRQAPFPSMVPPWAVQSMGRPLFSVWASHFLKVKDAQSLTMLGLVMGALDAQSTPPAILLTLPSPASDQPAPSSQSRQSLRPQLSVCFPPRSRSTVLPPTLTLLEQHMKERFRVSVDAADSGTFPHLNDSWSARTNSPQIVGWKGQSLTGSSALLDTKESYAEQGSTPQPGRRFTLSNKPSSARTRAAGILSSIAPPIVDAGDGAMRRTRSSSYCDPAAKETWSATAVTNRSGSPPHAETAEPIESLKLPKGHPPVSDAVPRRTLSRSDPSDDRLLLGFATTAAEYLSGQVLISMNPTPPETPVQENYAMQSWYDPKVLSAWGLIHCRTRLSLQWHKILLWMSARAKPDFYTGVVKPSISAVDSKEPTACTAHRLLISPLEWTYGRPPEAIYSWTSLQLTAVAILYPPDLAATAVDSAGESPARDHARLLPVGLDPVEEAVEQELQPQQHCTGDRSADGYGSAVLLRCAICRVVVRGIVILCPHCHHGGHFEHMFQWYASCLAGQRSFNCPSASCDCPCAAMGNMLGKHSSLQPDISSLRQFRVHRDSV